MSQVVLGLFLLLIIMPVCSIGPGLFFIRRLKWNTSETICASIGLSLIFAYLFSTAAYLLGIDQHVCWIWTAVCAALTFTARREIAAIFRSSHGRRIFSAFVFLLALGLILDWQIRHFSGGPWSGDWYEHYQRADFFYDGTKPLNTMFLAIYSLSARPPMMNILSAFFCAHVGPTGQPLQYGLFEIVSMFLNLLVFFPCVLLAEQLRRFASRRVWLIAALLAVNPFVLENVTWTWTKLFSAFYVLLAVALYLRSLRKDDPLRMIIAAVMMAAGIIVHYSAAPFAIAIALHYLLFAVRRRSHPLKEIGGSLLGGAIIVGSWIGWSLALYGTHITFGSNTTVTDSSKLSAFQNVMKVAENLFNTLVPHPLRLPFSWFRYEYDQPNLFGSVRDYFFALYQQNLPLSVGLFGSIAILLIAFRLRRSADFSGSSWRFWIFFATLSLLVGVASHGDIVQLGVAHVCLQPLALIGLTLLAAGMNRLPRWARILLLLGIVVDVSTGVLLQYRIESLSFRLHPIFQIPIDPVITPQVVPYSQALLNVQAVQNSALRYQLSLGFWADPFANYSTALFVTLIILCAAAMLIIVRAARVGRFWSIAIMAMLIILSGLCMSDRLQGYREEGALTLSGTNLPTPEQVAQRVAPEAAAVRAAPESSAAHYALGKAYYSLRQLDSAAAELKDAFILDPFAIEPRYLLRLLLGTHSLFLEDTDAWPAELYRRNPDDSAAAMELARVLTNHHFPTAAAERLREGLAKPR